MSLFKFLATGKSLIGMKDKASPYRMRPANLLPKFDSPKNPFAQQPKNEAPKHEPSRGATATGKSPIKADPRPMETSLLFNDPTKPGVAVIPVELVKPALPEPVVIKFEETVAKPVQVAPMVKAVAAPMPEAPRPKPVAVPAPLPPKPSPLSEWAKKINPLQYLPVREKAKGARAKMARTAVQTELSLDNVKVVRNDLSDTDLEVIPPRPAARPIAVAKVTLSESQPEPTTLNRLTSRLFGAEQPQVQ